MYYYRENFEFSIDELNYLRDNTKLDLISSVKLLIIKRNAEKYPILFRTVDPNSDLEIDYSEAEGLEYELRVNAWIKSCKDEWLQSLRTGVGSNLRAFARQKLDENLGIVQKNVKVRKK